MKGTTYRVEGIIWIWYSSGPEILCLPQRLKVLGYVRTPKRTPRFLESTYRRTRIDFGFLLLQNLLQGELFDWQVKSVAFYWMAERSTSCRNPRSEFCQILSPNNSGKFTVEIYRVPQSICPPCCRWDKPGYLPEIGENFRNPYQTIFSYSVQCDSSAQRPWLGWLRFGEFPRLWAATVATYCPSRMVEHPKCNSTQPSRSPDAPDCNFLFMIPITPGIF